MRRKIVGIVVMMLVATMVVSATNINMKEEAQPTSVGVDVPVWEVGDKWVYNVHSNEYKYLANGTLWGLWYNNCTETMEVTDDTGENYTLKMTSKNMEGRITLGKFQLKFTPFTRFTFEMIFRKADLADCSQFFEEKGLVFWLIGNILPFPAQYKRTWGSIYTPGAVILPFPLIAGTNGTLPGYSYTYQEMSSLYWGLIPLIDNPVDPFTASPEHYYCEMANITVPAGTYNAYNVSVDLQYGAGHLSMWRYYVPEVGWLGKQYGDWDWDSSGKPAAHYEWELVSTTYEP